MSSDMGVPPAEMDWKFHVRRRAGKVLGVLMIDWGLCCMWEDKEELDVGAGGVVICM